MRPAWESRKRRPRFILHVILSASMSACSFQAARVLNSFFPCPTGNWMNCSAVRHPGIGSLPPRRIELQALLPGYVSRLSRKGMSVRKLFKEYLPNIRTAISCLPSNGLSANTDFTSRSSVMSSTMPPTRCILTLPVTGLKSLMK